MTPAPSDDVLLAAMEWLSGHGRRPAALAVIDGRADLRGVNVAEAVRAQVRGVGDVVVADAPVKFAGARWSGVDFTGADFTDVILDKLVVDDCVFDKAVLVGTRWAGCSVSNSRFHRANMRSARLSIRWSGVGAPSRWVGCDFDGATYLDDGLDFTEFIDCRLTFKRWRGISYVNCHFVNSSFSGAMQRVKFDSRPLTGSTVTRPNWATEPIFAKTFESCDFSGAVFADVDFAGCTFADVKWPLDAWLLEVPLYYAALLHIRDNPETGAPADVKSLLSVHGAELKSPPNRDATLIVDLNPGLRFETLDGMLNYIALFRRANEELGAPPVTVHGRPKDVP